MLYGELKRTDIEKLDKADKVVIVPLASLEQHGQQHQLVAVPAPLFLKHVHEQIERRRRVVDQQLLEMKQQVGVNGRSAWPARSSRTNPASSRH